MNILYLSIFFYPALIAKSYVEILIFLVTIAQRFALCCIFS